MSLARISGVVTILLGLNFVCNAQEVQVDSLVIAGVDTLTYTAGGTAQTITVTVVLTENGGASTDGKVTHLNVYFTDSETFHEAGTLKSSPVEHELAQAVDITAGGTETITEEEIPDVLIDVENCQEYEYVCVVITAEDDTNPEDDYECLPFGTEQNHAGTKACPDVNAEEGSFKITNPEPSTLTYTTVEDTVITFEIEAGATDGQGTVTGVKLYFTDDDDYYEATVKSAAFNADGVSSTDIDDGKKEKIAGATATLKLDEEQCEDYSHLCAVLDVSSTDTDPENNADCMKLGSDPDEAGISDCSDSGVASLNGKLFILVSLSIALVKIAI